MTAPGGSPAANPASASRRRAGHEYDPGACRTGIPDDNRARWMVSERAREAVRHPDERHTWSRLASRSRPARRVWKAADRCAAHSQTLTPHGRWSGALSPSPPRRRSHTPDGSRDPSPCRSSWPRVDDAAGRSTRDTSSAPTRERLRVSGGAIGRRSGVQVDQEPGAGCPTSPGPGAIGRQQSIWTATPGPIGLLEQSAPTWGSAISDASPSPGSTGSGRLARPITEIRVWAVSQKAVTRATQARRSSGWQDSTTWWT